ncbi:hypothetical protein [Novosphingobium sp.]|uniref:hypothetical protein n=1 Tax=Novosphingobium sp. TaxID=1874826 RepID=UPI003B51B6A8
MAKSVNTKLRSGAKTGENAYKGNNTGETKPGAAHMRCALPDRRDYAGAPGNSRAFASTGFQKKKGRSERNARIVLLQNPYRG